MGDTFKPSSKTTYETGGKTTPTVEIRSGNVKAVLEVSSEENGTVAVKEKIEVKLPRFTFGISAKDSSNSATGERGSTLEAELAKKVEGGVGAFKWTAKAAVTVTYDESSKTSALDPGISMVKDSLSSSLKLTGTVSYGAIEGKAEGSVLSLGASKDALEKSTTGAPLLTSTVGTVSVFGQSLGANLLQMKPADIAVARARNETMAESVQLNIDHMEKGSPAYQAAASHLAQLEQSKINLKTAEVFGLAETAEAAIRNNTGEWIKTSVDGGRTVMWENKTDGTKLISDRGAERVILVRGDGSGEAFSYTNPKGVPSESFQFSSGAATQVQLMAGGVVQVTDGVRQLFGFGTDGLATSDASAGGRQGASRVWNLNEDGKYEQQYIDGVLRLEGAVPAGVSSNMPSPLGNNQGGGQFFEDFRRSAQDGLDGVISSVLRTLGPPVAATGNVLDRIKPIGSVAIDESLNATPTPAQVAQNLQNNLSPNGKETLGKDISDGPGKSHRWNVLPDGSVERIDQVTYGEKTGSQVTITSFAKGEVVPNQARQIVASNESGILSDALLKPDNKGEWAVVKIQLGGSLDLSAARVEFNPLPSSGTAGNSYTIQPGDSLWKIGKSIGLSDSETALFVRDTEANARASGAGGSINDLKPGNTLAFPDWVKSKQALHASQQAQEEFRHAEIEAQNFAEADPVFKVLVEEIKAFLQKPLPDALAVLADAGTGNQTDAAQGSGHPVTPVEPVPPAADPAAPVFKVADVPASDLTHQFIGGAYGAGQLGGYDVLPFNKNSSFLVNADGDMVGEINHLPNGYSQVKDLGGNAVYVNETNASVLTQDQYQQAQTQALDTAQASQAASAIGLMNSIIGLQHWGDMSDLQRTAALASIYNVVDQLTGGEALPGNLGTAASALGLLNALDKGDVGGIAYSGLSLVEHLTSTPGVANSGWISSSIPGGENILPGLSFALALDSGDPMSIASSGLSLMSSLGYIGPWGMVAAVVLSVLGGMFEDDAPDIPTREGLAHAQWDAAGNTLVITDQDIEGGGPTATNWMNGLVDGLRTQLAGVRDEAGNSYAMVPDLLPAIGFVFNPDGYNTGNGTNGFLYTQWTDENGQSQTRYYDGAGNRSDGTGETLAGDFMQHAARAIAPAWAVATTLAHYQQGQGIHLPSTEAGMPQEAADGIHQTLQAITLALPVEPALQNALIDIDGDEYLERTQWLATSQQVLAIDADGNNLISVNELLSLNGPDSLHSLGWLDANGDQMLTDRDPAFSAVRYWADINADANSAGETRTMAQAGIVAIDFGSNPPAVVHADGSRQALTVQMLMGDVLGVKYQAVEGGILQLDEQASGPAVATLHAVNIREFDGQMDHIHGGAADTDGGEGAVDAGDDRLVTTSANTIATQSAQTSATLAAGDARLRAGASGNTLAGQGTAQTAGTAQVRNNGVVFVPAGAVSVGAQMREATEDMVRSTDAASFAPLAVLAIGATAVQWPTVATAAASQTQDANAAPVFVPRAQAEPARNDLQTWESSRASAAAPISPAQESPQAVTPVTWDAAPRQAGGGATAAAQEPPALLAWTSPTITPPVNAANGGVLAAASAPAADVDDNTSPAASVAAPLAPGSLSTSTPLDYPEVHGEQVNSLEDIGLRFLETQLLFNDSTVNASARPDEPSLRISSVYAPVHGSVSLQTNAQGVVEVLFLPEANYHGPASFDYTVTDQYGLSSNARVSVVIAAVNDAPVTQDGNVSGTEDTVLYVAPGDLLGSASDADTVTDRQQLSISGIAAAQHGVAVLMPDGRVRFTPDADYNAGIDGPASFTYNVSDNAGGVTPATVWVSLRAVNDAPRLLDESTSTLEDQVLSIAAADLLANDGDVDNLHADLRITAVSDAVHGSVALQAQPDGSTRVLFTPEANFHGVASFRYTVTDPSGASSTATTQVVVAAVNDAPVTQDSQVSGVEDTAVYFTGADLLVNASDADTATDSQQLSISAIVAANHGVATLMPDGRVRFTPDADYNQGIAGPASFTYSVTDGAGGVTPATVWLSLAAVNDAPSLQDESTNTLEDQALSINTADLLANDSDVDNLHADLRISSVGDAVHGSVALQAQPDGSTRIIFTPEANFHGIASFRYTVTDAGGASSTATTQVVIAAVNDMPVTQDSHVFGVEDTAFYFSSADLLTSASDADTATDGQQLSISAITAARHGVAVFMPDGRIRFTPDADYNAGIDGPASFTYNVTDGAGGVTPATVWVSLAAVNDAPGVQDEFIHTLEDEVLGITTADLLANDGDVDSPHADLRISAVSNAAHGSVAIQAQPDGSSRIVFTPEANYHGQASFDYTVTDPDGQSSSARVNLDIAAVEDAPVTQDGNVSSTEDTVLYFTSADLLANASDADATTDGQQLSISAIVAARHGVAVLMPDGRVRFTPDADYNQDLDGPASFTYSVSDSAGGVTPVTVWVSLAAANDAPRLQGESTGTPEDQALSIDPADLLANDFDVDNLQADLRVSAVSDAVHGSVALQVQPDGSSRIVFVPEANYHGTASFNYTVTDAGGASSAATARIVVGSVNDAPVTQDRQVSGTEDTAIYFTQADFLAGASDPDTTTDGQQLSISAITATQHGVAVLMPDGRISFTPDADYNAGIDGLASFSYSVSDGAGGVTPATVWISLAAVNDAPRLQDEATNVLEDQVLSIATADLLANDFDVDDLHAALRISAVSDATHGSGALQAQPDGSTRVVFTPEADYHGIASFRYTVTDPNGASSMATAQIVVAAVNDAPVTRDSQASGTEDVAVYFTQAELLAGASDVDTATDNQQLSISGIVAAQHGLAVLMPDGRIRFTPDADYHAGIDGPASFTYGVSDGAGGVTPATVWVSLAAVNDAPRLQDETTNAVEDLALSIATADLLANDFDVDDLHAALRITTVSDATHGSVALQAQPDGSALVVFTPDANYHGLASFRYTVTDPDGASSIATAQVVVAAVNDAPITQDSQVSGTEDVVVYFTQAELLARASDVDTATDNQQLAISAILAAQNGVATLMPDGRVRFTPDVDYNQGIGGLASFTYGVSDGAGGVTPATVWVSLAAVNDAPRLQDETVSAMEDVVLSISTADLLANDSDVDDLHSDLRISAVSDATHGSVALQAQPDGSTRIVFTPEANFHGLASFRYTVTDPGGASSTATTQIAVAAVNDAPVTQDSQVSGTEDTAVYVTQADLLANASDVDTATDGQQLFISAIVAARHGVAAFAPDGRIRFTPDADYNAGIDGPASFSYSVSDGAGGVTPATVWVTLAAVNDAPRLQDDSTNTLEDQALSIDPAVLLANDGDVDDLHADLRISAVSDATHGSVALQAQPDGSTRIVFIPEANFHGIASFRYTVTDPSGASSTATTQVVVAAVNDAPVTQDSQVSGTEDTAVYLTRADLLANASDVDTATDGQQLSISAIVSASHGVATLMPDGRVRFTPDADYNQGISGLASFSYTVSDGAGGVTPATVWLSLAPVNDAPRLQDESANALEDQVLSIATADLLANDSDVDDPRTDLRISAVSDATHGSVALQTQADGSSRIIFTPEANYHGTASFRYMVMDPGGASSMATARIVLAAVNDVPVTQDGNVPGTEDIVLYFTNAGLLASASDPDTTTDGQQLFISAITAARHGVAVLMPDGRIRFTPDPDYNAGIDGPASFSYNVSDGAGGVTPATVWVSLAAVNDAPRLQDETTNALEDQVLSISTANLLANDSDVDDPHAGLRISAVSDAVHGSVALQVQPDGSSRVVFTPEANFHGIASFRYTVTDPGGASSIATARIALAAVNDAPVTQGETASGNEDTALLYTAASLLANDSDVDTLVDGDVPRITRVGLAEHGQVFLQADGSVRFEPVANYNGPAKFSYWVGDRTPAQIAAGEGFETAATVNLTILAVNDLPVVTGETMNGNEDIILNINPALLLANDTDVDTATTNAEPAQVLSITAVGNAQHGSIALLANGTLQFTPEPNYFGVAGFSYTVDDGHGGRVQGQVALNLAPINDAPTVLGETVSFNEDQIQTLTQAQLLANDSDVDNPQADLRIVSVENATHGTVSLNPNGSIRFAPDADYFGPAQFTYTVSDGAGGFTVGLASLDITAVNDAPRTIGEAATLNEDTQARFTSAALLANDSDVDNANLLVTAVGNASHGSVQIAAGEIVFTPDLNYSGPASFTYTVSDGAGGTSQATVTLTYNAVNDAPIVNNELVWGKRNVSYTLTQAALLANDTDVESPAASLRISSISNAQHGTAVLNADGSVRFTPEAGYAGRGSFDYVVQDPQGAGSTATAQIDFSRANVNPTATDDSFTGYEDIPFSITQAQLLVNDSDADNASTELRVSAVGGAQNGYVSLQGDGSIRFVPTADFNGTASFSYLVSDSDGGQTWATARLNVQSVNDAPIIDDVIFGRPVYGYLPGAVGPQDIAIYDEAQALALAGSGALYSRTYRTSISDNEGYGVPVYDYAMVTPTYYRNGHMRPVFVETVDATYQDPNNLDKWMYPGDGTRPIDDPYRQNGYIVAYDPDGNSAAISFAIASGPQHGHAWANQFTALSTPRDYSYAPYYAVGQTGAWQYYSQRGDPYSGSDPFTVAVTDGGGATTYANIYTAQVGSLAPVALDLDGGGLQYLGLDESKASFDVDQKGGREHLAWVAPGDALLARDIGGDKLINRPDEIAFTGYLPGAQTDLEGLAAFDSNNNHMLDRGDDKWNEFGAWDDKNANGISEAGEFRSLDEVGITQIALQSDQQVRQPAQGVTELGQSRMTWADGHTSAVGDVVLAVDGSGHPPGEVSPTMAASAAEPIAVPALEPVTPPVASPVPLTPQAMALQMVHLIATATAEWERMREDGPLGTGGTEIHGPQNVHEAMAATQAEWEQSAQSAFIQWHGS